VTEKAMREKRKSHSFSRELSSYRDQNKSVKGSRGGGRKKQRNIIKKEKQ